MKRIEIDATLTERQIDAALVHLPDMGIKKAKKLIADIFDTIVNTRDQSKRMTNQQFVMYHAIKAMFVHNNKMPTQQEIAEYTGTSRRSVRQSMQSLEKAGFIAVGSGHRNIKILDDKPVI